MIAGVRTGSIILASLALAACATAPAGNDGFDLFGPQMTSAQLQRAIASASAHPLGSEKNPVRASMPPGQRAYLGRLRCSDGNAPAFQRGGSVGEGPFGGIMDVYNLQCLTGEPKTASVYMDMYHDHVEDRAVAGFTIQPR